jgi:hypothetical protein
MCYFDANGVGRTPRSTTTPTLPFEVISLIIDYATTASILEVSLPLDHTSLQPQARLKPSFEAIRGLSSVSHLVRGEVLAAWFRTMVVREPGDWDKASQIGICTHVS